MAASKRILGLWWSRFHFLIRFLGLTGLIVSVAALTVAWREGIVQSWPAYSGGWSLRGLWEYVQQRAEESWNQVTTAAESAGWGESKIIGTVLLVGAGATLLLLVVELLVAVTVVSGRRSAFGSNALVQVGLAIALLVGVNAYSFSHYVRLDWSHDSQTGQPQFTLAKEITDQLGHLKGETLVVVYERHKTFGQSNGKPDDLDIATERKILEKVDDLVDQFREFGARFRVERLDVEDANYEGKVKAVTYDMARQALTLDDVRNAMTDQEKQELKEKARKEIETERKKKGDETKPSDEEIEEKKEELLLKELEERRLARAQELRSTIEKAPEDTIFFCSPEGKHSQRLSFSDFYQLDKNASKEQDNLVLLIQGVRPFADKVLNVEAKRPKIGIAVIHPALATTGRDDIGFPGLKTALESRGFEVQDVVLKKWSEFGPPTATISTVDESKLDELEEDQAIAEVNLKSLERARKQIDEELQDLRKKTLEELSKKYSTQLRGRKMTEEIRTAVIARDEEELADIAAETARQRTRRDEILTEKSKLNVDQIAEQRRIDDVQAKFAKILMDCDLLLIPRLTILDVRTGAVIPNRLYKIDEGQVNAIRDFLKAGKPVLACFGPANDTGDDRMSMMDSPGPDQLEDVFEQLGVRFGKQTVLFDSESESLASSRSSPLRGASRVPALDFEWQRGAGLPVMLRSKAPDKPNPLHEAMRVAARSLGKDSEGKDSLFDLRVRHPRPIYYEAPDGKELAWDPIFLLTSSASWNDDKPFPSRERTPHYERPKADDPDRGSFNEKRRGPFPVGIAVQTTIPAAWQSASSVSPTPVRIAVVGHGGLFTGPELPLAKEKLLLNTVNWLLGRDEYLPKADHQWSYPRVYLNDHDKWLWHWGTQIGLPALFLYVGLIVLLVRRVR